MKFKHLAVLAALISTPVSAQSLLAAVAHRDHVPIRLLYGIVMMESGGNCHARNGHAEGIGQVMPRTAHSVGVYGSLYNCRNGLEAAARYLHLALSRGGRGCAGLSLYNIGIAARPRCSSYGRRVLALANRR